MRKSTNKYIEQREVELKKKERPKVPFFMRTFTSKATYREELKLEEHKGPSFMR